MTCSPEQLASNRRNAAKSTGPKTVEGKAISRSNSLKHGLTGEGVVFLSDQTEAINLRIARLQEEMQPRTEMGSVLVERMGVLSVRLESCHLREVEVVHDRVALALQEFEDDRLDAADALFDQLPENPATCLRKLERDEPGLRKLLMAWTSLKSDLLAGFWKIPHGLRLVNLRGCKADDCSVLCLVEMSEAVQGRFEVRQSAQMNNTTRIANAKTQLTTLIDAEVDRLNQRLATLDPTELAQARALVIAQAKLEAAPAAYQIQKYEAATERSLLRMMKEARLVEVAPKLIDQAKTPRARAQAANPSKATASANLGSISPATKPAQPAAVVVKHELLSEREAKEFEAHYLSKGMTLEQAKAKVRHMNEQMEALNRSR